MSSVQQRRSSRGPVAVAVAALLGLALGWFAHAARPGDDADAIALSTADIAFAQRMSIHHQQALTLVDLLGRDLAPDVRATGEQIRAAQWREIGVLTGWLELAGAPIQPQTGQHAGHSPGGEHAAMPGMASDDEVTRLQQAKGVEAETLFLQLMIRHHQGGIDMAAEASGRTSNAAVRARVLAMVNEQQQELSMMTVLLDRRGGLPLTYP